MIKLTRDNKYYLGLGMESECYTEMINNFQYVLSHNRGLDGLYISVIEENVNDYTVYNYFSCQNFNEEFPELVGDFRGKEGKELLHKLIDLIPWTLGECQYNEIKKEKIDI